MTYHTLSDLVTKSEELQLLIVDEFLNNSSIEEKQDIPTIGVSRSEYEFIQNHSTGLTFYMNEHDAKNGNVSVLYNIGSGWCLYKIIK